MRFRVAVWCALGSALLAAKTAAPRLPPAPANPPAPSVQGPLDPGYAALIATCKTPPPAARGRGARGGAPGAAPPPGVRDSAVTEIPGVVAAGRTWTFVWQERGNNGDGIVGTDDGGLLIAQNDNSRVVKLDGNGKPSVAYSATHTGRRVVDRREGTPVHRRARPAHEDRAARARAKAAGGQLPGRAARLHR